MKTTFTKIFILFVFTLFIIAGLIISPVVSAPRLITPRDHSILLSAQAGKPSTPSIKLSWAKNELAEYYEVKRKNMEDSFFPQIALAKLDSNHFSYTDSDVEANQIYEYEVSAYSFGSILITYKINDTTYIDSAVGHYFKAFGYACSAIEAPAYDNYGKVLLLVDSTLAEALPDEIFRLEDDLSADGWSVVRQNVARTEQFDGQQVQNIKQLIYSEYEKTDAVLSTVFILGRVAVPYSGVMAPDGHIPDHLGAWPADLYYGTMDEWGWSDISANNTGANRPENRNIPGDGKFDQQTLGSAMVTLAIGRVDFYNMPQFVNDSTFTEFELYKKYLDKNHAYRSGQVEYVKRGLVDDNFGASKYYEGFASSGWRNLGSFFGPENVGLKDFFTSMKTENYLWAYGTGGGTPTSAGGIGNTSDFLKNKVNGVFTMLFGSYFGDWDSQNNFLRAGLCSDPSILTCCWAGRPQWYLHHMVLGFPIGYSAVLSQNNSSVYLPNYYWMPTLFPQYPNGLVYTSGNRNVHTALMGDPTLRLWMTEVPKPLAMMVSQNTENKVVVSWEAPDKSAQYTYNVYRAPSKLGPWTKVTDQPVKELSIENKPPSNGEFYYMVRTGRLDVVNTASVVNQSPGIMKSLIVTDVPETLSMDENLTITPNPAQFSVDIRFTAYNAEELGAVIYDLRGNQVRRLFDGNDISGEQSLAWNLMNDEGTRVTPGVYIIRIFSGRQFLTGKIVVLP
jgi:hypothetical protein